MLAVPLVLAACGSGSKAAQTTSTTVRPTQKQFVAAANAVCERSDRRVFRLGRLSLAPAGWARTAAAAQVGVAEMAKLTAPNNERARFARLLTDGRRLVSGIERVHAALVKRNDLLAETLQLAATKTAAAIHRQAAVLGLTFCQQQLTRWPA